MGGTLCTPHHRLREQQGPAWMPSELWSGSAQRLRFPPHPGELGWGQVLGEAQLKGKQWRWKHCLLTRGQYLQVQIQGTPLVLCWARAWAERVLACLQPAWLKHPRQGANTEREKPSPTEFTEETKKPRRALADGDVPLQTTAPVATLTAL